MAAATLAVLVTVLAEPAAVSDAKTEAPPVVAPPRAELIETVGGVEGVRDPFRPLEEMEPAAPWIDAQNAVTDRYMERRARPEVAERLSALFRIGTVGSPALAGPHVFFTQKKPGEQQTALYVKVGEGPAAVLIDPDRIDPAGRVAIDWYHPSRDGRLVAYGTSRDGDEVSTLRIIEVATGVHRPDEIPFTRAASLTWLPDDSGFVYTRNPGREAYDRHVFLHALGADPADDERLMGPEKLERTDWPGVVLSDDGRWLAVLRYVSWSESTLHLLDRQTGQWTDVAPEPKGLFMALEFGDDGIWAGTNHGAPLGRVVRIDPTKPQQADWIEVVPEAEGPLESFTLVPGGLVARHLVDAVARLTHHRRDGAVVGPVKLPVAGSARSVAGRHDDPRLIVGFDSFFYPPTLLSARIEDGALTPLETLVAAQSDVDTEAYTVEQVTYRSYDGTPVPMFLVHRKDLKRDGTHRVLLYGYGGFTVSLTPGFARNVLFWLEQGGVYAVANLRGGGEKGEAWHEAGMLAEKHQVFADFEYAMRYLLREGYTRPDRLAVLGGSNGGLLVGAAITRVPHLFRAAVAKVGLFDMMRYHRFPPGELWADEYGTADSAEQAPYLWAYSPYHQVVDGVRYPAVLAQTAEKDTRVHWAHTAKFVARLQEANASPHPVLLRFERAAGHGAGKATSAIAREYIEMYQFLLHELGMDPPATAEAR